MKSEDAEEYTQALGQVVAGGWRQIALGQRLGVPEALGLTVEDWVQKRLGGYVQLSIPERKTAAAELAAEGFKQREIAAVIGVNQSQVSRDLNDANASMTDENPKEKTDNRMVVDANASTTNDTLKTAIQATDDPEDLDYLMGHVERIAEVRVLQAEQPEKFAAAEIYEALRVAVEEAEQWQAHVDARYPGRASEAEWLALVQRLHGITQQLEDWTTQVNWREEATV